MAMKCEQCGEEAKGAGAGSIIIEMADGRTKFLGYCPKHQLEVEAKVKPLLTAGG